MRPLPLRLLLCAILLLNGIGSAVASTHVALAAAATGGHALDAARSPDADAMAADCPHAAARASTIAAASTSLHTGHGIGEAPMAADAECLKLCLDICLQQGHALLATGIAGPPAAPRAGVSFARPDMPAAGAAYPPLRPPIA